MAIVKFELKKEHLILLKHLTWGLDESNAIFTIGENETPYGGLSLLEDVGVMLYGQPQGEFDPLSPYGPQYTEEQIHEVETLYSQLPLALQVINFTQSFELGHYKSKFNIRNWKKYTPK